ncbi:hypothetical protein SAMN05421747_102171 [Parapedobacter composti]|uniref:Uncharacterized protein n=1 Tax=Parapedobacter composti TaxID=623281 RepID=A0A1I1F1X3_9SPHI|nr:hypothetical protein [Parapedobacter composti]SFB92966.1 hypothetical protein SAMN05421747_102171 [Parapedobacter composti]
MGGYRTIVGMCADYMLQVHLHYWTPTTLCSRPVPRSPDCFREEKAGA